MPKPDRPYLELTQADFRALSDQKAVELLRVQAATVKLKARHALLGLAVGTISYLASLGAFVYLVMTGHPRLSILALGTPVLTVIKRMLNSRV